MVTDEMMKRAIEAYAKDTGAEGFQLEGWIEPAIRAALEAALSAAEPQPAPSVAVKAAWAAKAAVLRSRGKNNTLHDINQAADYLDAAALSAQVQDVAGSDGAKAIAAERRRQIEQEGWTPQRDDQYVNGELLQAAACYALHDGGVKDIPPPAWPWSDKWWKPAGALRDFEKAGALIAAEIDRRLRAAAPAKQEG